MNKDGMSGWRFGNRYHFSLRGRNYEQYFVHEMELRHLYMNRALYQIVR